MFRILIIENNIKLRKRVRKILLSSLPFLNVAEASDEKGAFSEIEKKRPDLVIMGIHLTGGNGLNLTKKIKLRYPLIPIVINTKNDSPEYKKAAIQVGADYFLSKKSNTINDLVSLAGSIFSMASEDTNKTFELC
jgi:DNA-binding NarL/FixJ family response regulator